MTHCVRNKKRTQCVIEAMLSKAIRRRESLLMNFYAKIRLAYDVRAYYSYSIAITMGQDNLAWYKTVLTNQSSIIYSISHGIRVW